MSDPLLTRTCEIASEYVNSVCDRPVARVVPVESLLNTLGGEVPESGAAPQSIIEDLAAHADPGLVATAGGRYFGFVIGGTLPAAQAADWLVSAWDQNAGFHVLSPAAAVMEQIVAGWVLELLGLPGDAAVGFVTGCQMANFMGLAAARQAMLKRIGWDASADGLIGAPRIRIITSEERHGTIDRALAMLGLGANAAERVACDQQGRMRADHLERMLSIEDTPAIVCAQAGNVNTGAVDPLESIGESCRARRAWLHIDGAFGLWARVSRQHQQLVRGADLADSWATDAHKWLNVPYDTGIVIVRDSTNLLEATNYPGEYLVWGKGRHDPCVFTPESSRRARAIPVYAAIRELGRQGIAELVQRHCELAQRAARLLTAGGATILNEVVLNQLLVEFAAPNGEDQEAHMQRVIDAVQRDGTCWAGGTVWQGHHAMRISISGWRTSDKDIDRSVEAILSCASACAGGRGMK